MKAIWLEPLLCAFLTVSCAEDNVQSILNFQIEREYTDADSNRIIFNTFGTTYLYSLKGEGFTANVPFEEKIPTSEPPVVYFSDFKQYSATITLYQLDGAELYSDQVSWTRSNLRPEEPIFSFDKTATSNQNVTLLLVSNRAPLTHQIWLEGDIAGGFYTAGTWHDIPTSNRIPLSLSQGEGSKTVRAKYRNRVDYESQLVESSITLDSTKPQECQIQLLSETINIWVAKVQVTGNDSSQTEYRVYGDVEGGQVDFTAFNERANIRVPLLEDIGNPLNNQRSITVQVKDVAENYCDPKTFTVTYDPNHVDKGLELAGGSFWTDEAAITVRPTYEFLPGDEIEMLISGQVDEGETTKQWIPYSSQTQINLTSNRSNKTVNITFRDKNAPGSQTAAIEAFIFHRPGLYFFTRSSDQSTYVTVDNIRGLSTVTLRGCSESYDAVAYATFYDCTPTGDQIEADFTFSDQSSITRSVRAR